MKMEKVRGSESADSDKKQQSKQAASDFAQEVAEKVNWLFESFRKPDGTAYSNKDVEDWSKSKESGDDIAPIEQSWVWKLAHAQAARPSLPSLRTISSFFGVDASFWVKPLGEELKKQALLEGSGEQVKTVALKLVDLSPQSLGIVSDLVDSIRRNELR